MEATECVMDPDASAPFNCSILLVKVYLSGGSDPEGADCNDMLGTDVLSKL